MVYDGEKPYETTRAFIRGDTNGWNRGSEELRERFLEYLKIPQWHVMSQQEQADAMGVHETTIGRWKARVPEAYWNEALKISRERHARQSFEVDAALMKQCREGNVKAIELFYRKVEGWEPKQSYELTRGRDKELESRATLDLVKEIFSGLSDEEKREVLAAEKTPKLPGGAVIPEGGNGPDPAA